MEKSSTTVNFVVLPSDRPEGRWEIHGSSDVGNAGKEFSIQSICIHRSRQNLGNPSLGDKGGIKNPLELRERIIVASK